MSADANPIDSILLSLAMARFLLAAIWPIPTSDGILDGGLKRPICSELPVESESESEPELSATDGLRAGLGQWG
jgi:hypothetical protein